MCELKNNYNCHIKKIINITIIFAALSVLQMSLEELYSEYLGVHAHTGLEPVIFLL